MSVYHEGERRVQQRAGYGELAEKVGRIVRSTIPPAAQVFVAGQRIAIAATVDAAGRVWASLLAGEPGFLEAVDEATLAIRARPALGDPLQQNLHEGAAVGLLVIDPPTRRRMRLNGSVIHVGDAEFLVRAAEVYSNCPQYIHPREHAPLEPVAPRPQPPRVTLTPAQTEWIGGADTFFIASFHAERGADASHRGGAPGFVRVLDPRTLLFPDYSGNRMFNTLGNLAANPACGLLFVDFEHGHTLQLSGTAEILWDPAGFADAERAVRFQAERVMEIRDATGLRMSA